MVGVGHGPWWGVADFVPKRDSIVWGRADVSLAVVYNVLHSSMPYVARISSNVLGGLERVVCAFSNAEFATKCCHRCVGL